MDAFVSVGVFIAALLFILAVYGYVQIHKHNELQRKAEADAAWKREQARQRRAQKKLDEQSQEAMRQMSEPMLKQRGNLVGSNNWTQQ